MPVAIPSRRYFSALELEPDHVGEEEIRAAYKRLALKWHPDRHANDKDEAQQKFIEVNEAYTVLLEYYQHRKRGSPHPEKRPRQEHSRPAPDAGASPHEHRSEDAQSSHSRTHNESDAHSTTTSQRRPGFFPKRSKLDLDPPPVDADSTAGADVIDYDFINLGTPIPPLRSPHHPSDHPRRDKDWTFPLRLTLDDLYHARAHHYRITRTLRSGATESVKIPIPVDPAWRTGTRVLVPGMGNERADGSFQDIVFVVEQEHHPRFMRQGADLVAAVQVPWAGWPKAEVPCVG
ncbi:hypothetical protein EVJ58_g8864 [Rhodofomes roseus]|uniref:J domain-containing protein n=1 Tax=Rhodofomes roseus TaxID=34475 RepID=A0A4Y9Y0Q7_9APHY|nr:hypothetical protein EVJ58_g8864 [Rhodofomes roseus]